MVLRLSFTMFLLLISAGEMGLGFLVYRYGSALVRRLQAHSMTEAERRGWGEFAGDLARGQVFILKLGGAIFGAAGVVSLIAGLLNALGVIHLG